MKNNKLITDIDNKLTKKNWKFIQYRAQGLSVPEAYKLAGYSGTNEQMPYQLNHKLKDKISEIAQGNGFNREKLMTEINNLVSKPLTDDSDKVSVDQKIKILRLFKDCLPEVKKDKQTISRFQVLMMPNGQTAVNVDISNQDGVKMDISEQNERALRSEVSNQDVVEVESLQLEDDDE